MGDLAAVHTQAKKLILTIRAGLERLETAEQNSRAIVPTGLSAELQQQVQQLQRLSGELDAVWRMQSLREPPSKRDVWKRKVEQVAEETDALAAGLQRFTHRQQRRHAEERQRQELLERRHGGGGPLGGGLGGMEAEVKAARHVTNSKRVLEEAYETGVDIVGAMSGQRERLKATHRKVLDVLNTIGLSDSLLRLVERRHRLDKLLVYGGMLGTLLVVAGVYWLVKLR
ncbi:Qb-SNARE Bos1 Membrin family [Micractinium conductrix]|uniref:Membrin n=1 Tax=Micractinium conductrix TaxID=554055 RepID=A0A2P6VHC9_9CHLO|nr:Qb-SNARE Bos1 Membrin family [Micractinium conductrix]|eukprot:PSC73478.1 Qb-SNARE Bos1 Membrin family [Micractinium conductrix]